MHRHTNNMEVPETVLLFFTFDVKNQAKYDQGYRKWASVLRYWLREIYWVEKRENIKEEFNYRFYDARYASYTYHDHM